MSTIAAGTTATTALVNTGDTTGKLTFQTNGTTTAMTIDTSQNVGIGTASPACPLDVSYSNTTLPTTGGGRLLQLSNTSTSASATSNLLFAGVDAGGTSRHGAAIGWLKTGAWTAGGANYGSALLFYTRVDGGDTTERMRIDSSGNVGIGTATPLGIFDVSGTGTGSSNNWAYIRSGNVGTNNPSASFTAGLAVGQNPSNGNSDTALVWGQGVSGNQYFSISKWSGTTRTEQMRITSGGEVYIAGTADQGAYNLQCNGTGVWGAGAYVNGSDARIKENVAPIASGLSVVEKLNPVTFRYKQSWSKDQNIQPGFIAQELQAAMADEVYVDGVVQQGPEYMSVAYQTLIPVLTKAIQELKAEVDSLKAQLAKV